MEEDDGEDLNAQSSKNLYPDWAEETPSWRATFAPNKHTHTRKHTHLYILTERTIRFF